MTLQALGAPVPSNISPAVLIKLGGAALAEPGWVGSICGDLARIRARGIPLVIVHGGGPSINEELRLHGLEWRFIEGQRVTSPEMMDVVEMVLCGSVNRRVVRALNAAGAPAVGMSGSDARMLLCAQASRELGQVGRIETVNAAPIRLALDSRAESGRGYIPVIAPTGVGPDGSAFNVNADWAAARIAEALGIHRLIYLTDQEGILDSGGQLIPELEARGLQDLIETGVVRGGMLAKARTVLHALNHGVKEAHVLSSRGPECRLDGLLLGGSSGTVCRATSHESTRREMACHG